MSINFRNVVAAAGDQTPLLTGQTLGLEAILVACSSVETLDEILDEVGMETISEMGLTVDQTFDVLMRENHHVCDKSTDRNVLRGLCVNLLNGGSAREGELILEKGDHLVDCNVLDTRNVVLVTEDEEIDHELPVVPGTEGRIVRTSAAATNFVVGDPTNEPTDRFNQCDCDMIVLYFLANDVRRIFWHLDNAVLRFGGPTVLDGAGEERRVEGEDLTEPSEVNLLSANDKSHQLLLDIGTSGGLKHDVAV